jgi:hypothetical protein
MSRDLRFAENATTRRSAVQERPSDDPIPRAIRSAKYIVKSIIRQAGLTNSEFFELLKG